MTAPVTAQAVRAALRSAGVRTSHDRSREGVRCPNSRFHLPIVTVDFNSRSEAERTATAIGDTLTRLGFAVTVDRSQVRVTGRSES